MRRTYSQYAKSVVDKRNNNDHGFSLMELIVTVVILGIIVAIAIPFFFNAQDSARQAAVETAARDGHTMARASIIDGSSPHGGDLSVLETDDVVLTLADTFVIGDESTVCVRADWIGTDNYAISGPCDESDTTAPIIDREDDDPLYTELTYQCPITKTGYLGIVNVGDETRAQIWDKNNRDATIREVMYNTPDDNFELRHETRQEILRTRITEQSGIEEANRYIDEVSQEASNAADADAWSIANTIDNVSELIEMEGGVTYTVRFDGEIETFAAPGHRGYGQGNVEESLADCLVGIEHFGDDINLKNIVYLGGDNLVRVPENIPESVRALRGAFENAIHFDDPSISSWDVSNVHTARSMFHTALSFNQDISEWDTGSLVIALNMFRVAESFNQDISDWDVSNVETMEMMFLEAESFNQDLNSWDTSSVTDMNRMFFYADSFNGDVSDWDTSNVTNMRRMFDNAASFNQDIGDWDTANVTSMHMMFVGAVSFNQDIGRWSTGNVTSMHRMFDQASVFNQDLSNWDVSSVDNFSHFHRNSGLVTSHLPPDFR